MVFKALHDLAAAYLCYLIMFSISVVLSFRILISSGEHTRFVDFGTFVLIHPSAWRALPSRGQMLITHILAQTSLSQRSCLTALSEGIIDTP